MKYNKLYLSVVCLLLFAGGWGCSKEGEPGAAYRESVCVEFQLPSTMGTAVPETRVAPLDTMTLYPLPEGTTLWLTVSEKQSDDLWVKSEPKPYVVLASGSGYNSLHACSFTEVTEDGVQLLRVDPTTISAPLYLEAGTYKFRIIAPALDMRKTDMRIKVDNGVYFYSSDDRYENTQALEQNIVVNVSGTQNITLNPIIQQVARMQFTLYGGNNVSSLEIMPAGIEISGIQNAEEAELYNWSSESLADTLKMEMGSKRGTVVIQEFRQSRTTVTEGGVVVQKASLVGDTGILPTDARSNSISVLLNLRVNGIPTQYMLLLNGQILYAAHTYNYRIAVSMVDGVVVATWMNYSWGVDVPLQ